MATTCIAVHTISQILQWLNEQRVNNTTIGLVPTMGALHAGHLSLVQAIKPYCNKIVMSVFLNPTQFNSQNDYDHYPRRLKEDIILASSAEVDVIFAPSVEEMYPEGLSDYTTNASVRVHAGSRAERLCGATRHGHFDGVVHVVCMLFNIISPDYAVFGEKDYQQLQVIRQMVKDLHYDINIIPAPIIREQSGLALSSRNELLHDKNTSLAIYTSLLEAKKLVTNGEFNSSIIIQKITNLLIHSNLKIDYVEIVDEESLTPIAQVSANARLLIAVFCNNVRLIDNIQLI